MSDRAFSLFWVMPSGVDMITERSRLPSEVGAKARGLLGLPPAWVPPFLVLSPGFHQQFKATSAERRADMLRSWTPLLEEGLDLAGLNGAGSLYLRSNAVTETLSERGRYRSVRCDRAEWLQQLAAFYEEAERSEAQRPLGLIVQRAVAPRMWGHLSNERRVAEEYRDAVVELVDETSGEMKTEPLTFRRWRKSMAATTDALACASRDDLLTVLREPLALAAEKKQRVHYEWVWDGQFVYVVQADPAPESDAGVAPTSVLGAPQQDRSMTGMQLFREARRSDESRSGKLKNHFLYEDNGFRQPPFFLLDNAAVLGDLLRGKVDERLISDLDLLTYRPLVIRTSAPGNTLLPRSDLLCTSAAALQWLTGSFKDDVLSRALRPEDITLLAHHFIPALAAAFSTGSPDKRDVYVEALWGIPEGLFYYPCDAYFIDTRVLDPTQLRQSSKSKFTFQKVVRHKSEFVAPDADGRFVLHPTARPWDWKSTIENKLVLADIGFFTRTLAFVEHKQIKLMWFLQCEPWTGLPSTLPWYHDNEAEWPGAQGQHSPNSRDEKIDIRTLNNLESLEKKAAAGYRSQGKRIVVTLNPAEHQIIRNLQFAERVGNAAARLNAVVELQGGILSHVYYALKRCKATVTVKNPASFSTPPAAVQKLVRDKIPEVVAAAGEVATISHLPPEQRRTALKIKLVEEALEVRDSNAEELIHEIADVLDVVDALIDVAHISRDELEDVRRKKQEDRGGFEDGVVLIATRLEDNTISGNRGEAVPLLPPDNKPASRIVNAGQPSPLEEVRPGPFDVRHGDDFVEFVHTSTFRVTHPEWVLSSPRRVQVDGTQPTRSIEWTLEGKRQGAQVKLRLKILLGTQQLSLPLKTRGAGEAEE